LTKLECGGVTEAAGQSFIPIFDQDGHLTLLGRNMNLPLRGQKIARRDKACSPLASRTPGTLPSML